MKIPKLCLSKDCLKKALRTFLQTAIGYIITNLTLYFSGVDFGDKSVLKNAAIGLAIAAFSAGSAAVMNLEKADDKGEVNSEEDNKNRLNKEG